MDFIKESINNLSYKNGNQIIIYTGKSISEHIFKDKYNFSEYLNYMDLIPLITSIFSIKPNIFKISETCCDSIMHIHKEKIDNINANAGKNNTKCLYKDKYQNNYKYNASNNAGHNTNNITEKYIRKQLIETYYNHCISNNNSNYLLKYYQQDKIPAIYFNCNQKYHFKEKYLKIVWENKELNYKIHLILFKNYFKLGVKISIAERVEMVPFRKKKIWEHLSLFDKIISQLKSNN